MENKKEKTFGCIIGAALADCLGYFREFGKGKIFTEDKGLFVKFINKSKGYRYTDDTQMALSIIKSIVRQNGEIVVENIKETFVADYIGNPFCGYGPGTRKLFELVSNKRMQYADALKFVNDKNPGRSFGNGAPMRIHPIGLFMYNKSDDELYNVVESISRLTHLHPLATDAAVVLAKAVSLCFKDEVDEYFIDKLVAISKTDFKKKIESVKNYLNSNASLPNIRDSLGIDITSQGSVPFAIYSFLREKYSYNRCLMTAISHNGDADTIGSMACSLSGAYLGIKKINNKYYKKIENINMIEENLEKFHQLIN